MARVLPGLLIAIVLAGAAFLRLERARAPSVEERRTAPLARASSSSATELDAEARAHQRAYEARAPLAGDGLDLPYGAELVLLCYDANARRVVPGAVVHVEVATEDDEVGANDAGSASPAPASDTAPRGARLVADEHGRVRLERPRSSVSVEASLGELAASATIDEGTRSPVVLNLARPSTPTIEIVTRDEHGALVAGVPVHVVDEDYADRILWRGRTDSTGRASAGVEHGRVVAALPLSPPIEQAVAHASERTEPVVLVVPRFTEHELVLVGADGCVLPVWTELEVLLPEAASSRLDVIGEVRSLSLELENGSARLAWPEGLARCALECRSFDAAWTVDAPGPSASPIDLRLAADSYSCCTVVDEAERPLVDWPLRWTVRSPGAWLPLANRPLHWTVRNPGAWSPRFEHEVRTDAEGRCVLERVLDAGECFVLGDLETEPLRIGELATRVEGGPRERFPRVRLAPAELALTGRVVDTLGAPLAYAELETKVRFDQVANDFATARSDALGRFTLRGPRVEGPLEVRVRREDEVFRFEGADWSEVKSFAFGARDVVLTVEATGGLEGELWVDPNVDCANLDAYGYDGERWIDAVDFWPDGERVRFRVRNAQPGTYSLHFLHCRGYGCGGGVIAPYDLAASVANVVIEAGVVTRDPRLDALDLRGKLRHPEPVGGPQHTLRVVDAEGRSIASGWLGFRKAGSSSHAFWSEGRCVVPGGVTEFAVWSPGYDVLALPLPKEDGVCVLTRLRATRVEFALSACWTRRRVTFTAYIDPKSPSWMDEFKASSTLLYAALDAAHGATLELPAGARYAATLRAEWGTGDGEWLQRDAVEFEIVPGGAPVVRLQIDEDALERDLREDGAQIDD